IPRRTGKYFLNLLKKQHVGGQDMTARIAIAQDDDLVVFHLIVNDVLNGTHAKTRAQRRRPDTDLTSTFPACDQFTQDVSRFCNNSLHNNSTLPQPQKILYPPSGATCWVRKRPEL